jgi:hypothetical protein
MDFYTLVTCAWMACTPMFDYPTHLTKAQCELAAKGLKEASCVPENNLLIAKKRDH